MNTLASPPPQCSHKRQIGCELTSVLVCCSCADRRPQRDCYPVYVDGLGMTTSGTRWQSYCSRCRDFFKDASRQRDMHDAMQDVLQRLETWSFAHLPPNHEHTVPSVPAFRAPATAQAETRANPTATAPPPRNPFGTREEWESPDYVSPLTTMYSRAWTRYRDAEAARQERNVFSGGDAHRLSTNESATNISSALTSGSDLSETTRLANITNPSSSDDLESIAATYARLRGRLDRPRARGAHLSRPPPTQNAIESDGTDAVTAVQLLQDRLNRSVHIRREQREQLQALVDLTADFARGGTNRGPSPPRPNPIDVQARPPPPPEESLTINIACRICNEQRMDTLTEPCMHLAMCHWCVDVLRQQAAETRRRRQQRIGGGRRALGLDGEAEQWRCPVCRGVILSVRRVYFA